MSAILYIMKVENQLNIYKVYKLCISDSTSVIKSRILVISRCYDV